MELLLLTQLFGTANTGIHYPLFISVALSGMGERHIRVYFRYLLQFWHYAIYVTVTGPWVPAAGTEHAPTDF